MVSQRAAQPPPSQLQPNDAAHIEGFINAHSNHNVHHHPADLVRLSMQKGEEAKRYLKERPECVSDALTNPSPKQFVEHVNYVAINSIDRNWLSFPMRNKFSLTFNGSSDSVQNVPLFDNMSYNPYTDQMNSGGFMSPDAALTFGPYNPTLAQGLFRGFYAKVVHGTSAANLATSSLKNIVTIEVSKVVVPIEIIPSRSDATLSAITSRNKSIYEHNFSFNFPYILLQIDELDNNYIATNDHVRKAFCYLIFSSCYTDTNGRSYAILEPSQEERKVYYPPRASLQTLSISLRKPNGELLNASKDGQRVTRILYTNTVPEYMELVCDSYFDKNEWYIGDYIQIVQVTLPTLSTMDAFQVGRLQDFINRPEGHQIYQIGAPNPNSYCNSFYIRAPGAFNSQVGCFDTDFDQISQLVLFNDLNIQNVLLTGRLLNMSLQNTMSFKIGTLQAAMESTFDVALL